MKTDYQLLKPLTQILKLKNLSQAAATMGMSQPAMSRIFEKAKYQFKDELMVRSANQYFLTPRGSQLLVELRKLLPEIDLLWSNDAFEPSSCDKEIKIAGSELDLEYILPKLLSVRKLAPQLNITLRPSHPNILNNLALAELDIVITAFEHSYDGLYREMIKQEPYVALVSKQHTGIGDQLSLDTYLSSQHGIFAFDEHTRWSVDKQLESMGEKRNVTLSIASFSQIRSFINHSPLIFSLPQQYALQIASETGSRVLPLPFEVPDINIYLYWHKRLLKDPLNCWVRAQLLAQNEPVYP
jgi:DNA-binding transcriptional LysR family regulator